MVKSNKELLELENRNISTPSEESVFLVCKNNRSSKVQNSGSKCLNGESRTSSVPTSQVLGKVKDFLGIMAESNKVLEKNAKDNANDFNIEMLNDTESDYIEMDLMLGVTDLHTPEAIAAAEAAIAGGQQQLISLDDGTDSEDSSSSSDSNEENVVLDGKEKDNLTTKKRKRWSSNKKQKIVELP